MNLRLDYNNMMTEAIGSEGLEESVFEKNAALIEKAYKNVMDNRGKGWQEWCDLPFVKDDYPVCVHYGADALRYYYIGSVCGVFRERAAQSSVCLEIER